MANKGANYERSICGQLSKWWTGGKDDDVFWRASSSGGRAKFRGRKGRKTHGQHGDITATNPIGEPLIDLITIEIKRGYSAHTVADVLDCPSLAAVQKWEGWLEQVYESHEQAGSYSWMLITKRDRREPLCFFPYRLFRRLSNAGAFSSCPLPFFIIKFDRSRLCSTQKIIGIQLADFLRSVRPDTIIRLSQTL